MKPSPAMGLIASIAVIVAAIAIQVLWGAPRGHMLWSAVFDAGHAPLFGVVAVAALQGLVILARARGRGPSREGAGAAPPSTRVPRPLLYLAALLFSIGIGGLTEASQYFGLRDADPRDFAHDVYGALAFLALAYALDRHAPHRLWGGRIPARLTRAVLALGAAALLLAVAVPVLQVARDYLGRNRAFPSICDFEAGWERRFVGPRDADLDRVPVPEGWLLAQGSAAHGAPDGENERVGRLTFHVAIYPALHIMEPYPDWSGYDRLVFEIYAKLDAPRELSFRINDNRHDNTYADRFNRILTIAPGLNRYEIELEDVARGPRNRRLDLTHVRNASLFAVRPEAPFRIWVDGFRLERD